MSAHHNNSITVLKTTFPKVKPKEILYRNYKFFDKIKFESEVKNKLTNNNSLDYVSFEQMFMDTLDKHAPLKKKIVRANHAPYVTKNMRKAIMRRSALENVFYKKKRPLKVIKLIKNKKIIVAGFTKKNAKNFMLT